MATSSVKCRGKHRSRIHDVYCACSRIIRRSGNAVQASKREGEDFLLLANCKEKHEEQVAQPKEKLQDTDGTVTRPS